MSEFDQLYGCIFAGGLLHSPIAEQLYLHNKDIITQLPRTPHFDGPLIIRQMFSVPIPSNFPYGEGIPRSVRGFHGYQMIHFAASYNNITYTWERWLIEFEAILKRLYWHKATIHLLTEMRGDFTYQWKANIEPLFESPPQTIQIWEFMGAPRNFNFS